MMGQLVPITGNASGDTLYFDVNRVWSYDRYQKSRWGAGLQYDISLNSKHFTTLSIGAYGAYGYADERLKGGGNITLFGDSVSQSKTYIEFIHDLTPDASRNLYNYQITDFMNTANFWSERFSESDRLSLGHGRRLSKRWSLGLEARWSSERRLYDAIGLIYPSNDSVRKALPKYNFLEGRITVGYKNTVTLQLTGGIVDSAQNAFVRLLAQYDKVVPMGFLNAELFAQAGVASENAPYSRLFDLGGNWGCPLLLGRSIMTARPVEFTASSFAMLNLRLITNPLFNFYNREISIGSAPRPFVMFNAMWGHLWNQDDNGRLLYDQLPLQSPNKGLFEVGAGVEGILLLGQIQWGAGVAYRLAPETSIYHNSNTSDNLTFVITATINLDVDNLVNLNL
jgi:hypothetical protein